MSVKSQTANMRRLALLMSQDLRWLSVCGESKSDDTNKTFLNIGRAFLRELSKDLGLRCAIVTSETENNCVSAACRLYGLWSSNGICISLEQCSGDSRGSVMYRSIRDLHDHKGGYQHFLQTDDLCNLSYEKLLNCFTALRKDICYERAA